MDKYKDEYEDEVSRHDAEVARAVAAWADPAPPGDHTMSDTTPLYSPTLHPFAAAYAAASEGECRAARQQWVASDEERGYRFVFDRARGLRRGDPIPPRWESPLRCRPSELQRRLDEWATATTAKLKPVLATYWIVCHAYPINPRTDHGLPTECICTVRPKAPSCLRSMAHDWRFVDPSTHECARCGLRHQDHAQADQGALWPWENYSWSGEGERIS